MNTVIAWATQKLAEAGTPGTPGYDAKAAQEAQMMLTLAGGKQSFSQYASGESGLPVGANEGDK